MNRRSFLRAAIALLAAPVWLAVKACRLIGDMWTWPGDLHWHLIQTHGMPPDYVWRQPMQHLIAVHNGLHEGRYARPWSPPPRQVMMPPVRYQYPTLAYPYRTFGPYRAW